MQYGTTADFLDLFHLSSLKELPKLREINEILQEQEQQEYLTRQEGLDVTLSYNNQVETMDKHEK